MVYRPVVLIVPGLNVLPAGAVTFHVTALPVMLEPVTFHILDSDGERAAAATNFPLSLAYATTIHKAQGTTLDEMSVDLRHLWEPGHAYVALSRVRSPRGLYIGGWNPRSILVDPQVSALHRSIGLDGSTARDFAAE